MYINKCVCQGTLSLSLSLLSKKGKEIHPPLLCLGRAVPCRAVPLPSVFYLSPHLVPIFTSSPTDPTPQRAPCECQCLMYANV